MNKKLLILALVASNVALAGKFTINTEHKVDKLEKTTKLSDVKNEVNLGVEHTIGKSGVTLGGNFKFENDLFKKYEERKVKELNSNIKYDMPELVKGLNSYVKGNLKFAGEVKSLAKPELTGEFELSYKKYDVKYSFNSKTVLKTSDLSTDFEHQLKAKGKVEEIDAIEAGVKVKHNTNKKVFVEANVSGSKEIIKDTTLTVSDDFGIVVAKSIKENNYEKAKFTILSAEYGLKEVNHLKNNFKIGVKYAKDGLEASATTLVETIVNDGTRDINKIKTAFGEKLEVKYKGVKNLELSASGLFAGLNIKNKEVKPLVVLGAGVLYKAEVTNNLSLTPSINGEFKYDFDFSKMENKLTGSITPKVAVEYKASKDVTLKSSVETKSSFEKTGYKGTSLKATTGLEYKW